MEILFIWTTVLPYHSVRDSTVSDTTRSSPLAKVTRSSGPGNSMKSFFFVAQGILFQNPPGALGASLSVLSYGPLKGPTFHI